MAVVVKPLAGVVTATLAVTHAAHGRSAAPQVVAEQLHAALDALVHGRHAPRARRVVVATGRQSFDEASHLSEDPPQQRVALLSGAIA